MFEFPRRAGAAAAALLVTLSACGADEADNPDAMERKGDTAAEQPAAPEEVAVRITDETFEMPATLEAEPVKFVVSNADEEPHSTFFARLNEGVTPEEVRKAFAKSPDALFPLITVAGSIEPMKPGATSEAMMQLPEGNTSWSIPRARGRPP